MAAINSIGKRLEFIKISEETRATLREMRPLIARVLPGILDEFYRHVAGHAEVARLFPDQAHMQHAKAMQLKHWDMIASATFDEGYVTSVTRIGEAHNRLGLEPRWYIGGYAILMAGLARAIECETQAGFLGGGAALQEKKAKMLQAMISAALLDMDFAISVYLESGLRAKQETLDRLGASFRGVTRSDRRHAQADGGNHATRLNDRGERFRADIRQCAGGGCRRRGTRRLDPRDQRPGAGIKRDRT
jgi:hemoglobin-like flavoprotein